MGSGLCLVTEHNPFSHSVVVGLWFPVGSRFESPGEFGAYHFIEHLVFKSKTALKLVKQIESVGGDVNAFTAHEHTCYHVTCLRQDIELALRFLACVRSELKITKDDFEKEKAVILQEIRSHQDDIEDEVHRFFMSQVLADSPLSHSISGESYDVEKLNLEQLKKIHQAHYRKSPVVLSVTGNFDKKNLGSQVGKAFGYLKGVKASKEKVTRAKTKTCYYPQLKGFEQKALNYFKPGVYLKQRKTQQLYFTVSFPLLSIYSDERFAGSLLNSWFGQGMTSYLFRKLREDLGLVYFVHSHITTFLDQGLFLIEASCELQNMPEVIEIIFREIKNLAKKDFSKRLLDQQKKLLRGQVLLGAEDLENRMQSVALNELIFNEYRSPEQYLKKFDTVNAKDVKKFITERLRLDLCAVVLYGAQAKTFKPFIENQIESLK